MVVVVVLVVVVLSSRERMTSVSGGIGEWGDDGRTLPGKDARS